MGRRRLVGWWFVELMIGEVRFGLTSIRICFWMTHWEFFVLFMMFEFLSAFSYMVAMTSERSSGWFLRLQGVLFPGHPYKQRVVKCNILQINISCLLDSTQVNLMQLPTVSISNALMDPFSSYETLPHDTTNGRRTNKSASSQVRHAGCTVKDVTISVQCLQETTQRF